jgi:NAD(P)-dependent dehydrogenase (short-subunit alcohol dehydrogenase family)
MGRAAAIAYAREGADIAINYLPSEEPDAKEVIDLIKAEGRIGLAIPGDLRDEKFCQELVDRAVKGLGGLDIVVSNAGRQQTRASILDVTTDDFDATMDHQGGIAAFEAGFGHHRNSVRAGLRPVA